MIKSRDLFSGDLNSGAIYLMQRAAASVASELALIYGRGRHTLEITDHAGRMWLQRREK